VSLRKKEKRTEIEGLEMFPHIGDEIYGVGNHGLRKKERKQLTPEDISPFRKPYSAILIHFSRTGIVFFFIWAT
jgi:hypothetical protein